MKHSCIFKILEVPEFKYIVLWKTSVWFSTLSDMCLCVCVCVCVYVKDGLLIDSSFMLKDTDRSCNFLH